MTGGVPCTLGKCGEVAERPRVRLMTGGPPRLLAEPCTICIVDVYTIVLCSSKDIYIYIKPVFMN
jgi:hypothetical protein